MKERDHLERLRKLTGRAVAESSRKEAALRHEPLRSPRPGDVYVWGEDPDSPVEWVVLTAGAADPQKLLVVPADTNPMAGIRDLVVNDLSAGPLVLRLGLASDLAAGAFKPTMRRGTLEAESLELARQAYGELESGELRSTVRQREMDFDPAYEDWIRDHVEPARHALLAAAADLAGAEKGRTFLEQLSTRPPEPVRQMVPARWVYALAAALVLVSVGLSGWIVSQQQQIDRLSRPSFNLPIAEMRLNEVVRSVDPIAVPDDASHLLLYLSLAEPELCESYELGLFGNGDLIVWSQTVESWPVEDFNLMLSRAVLEQAPLTLRLYATCGGERKLLDDRQLRIASF